MLSPEDLIESGLSQPLTWPSPKTTLYGLAAWSSVVITPRLPACPAGGQLEKMLLLDSGGSKLPDRVLTKKLGSRNYPNSRLGLRWARIQA